MIKHNRPYRLQLLNNCYEVKVTKQVLVQFFIGKYVDKVLCDVVSMYASHISYYDKFKNRYSLEKDGRAYTLVLLLLR
jgi:hypothetical protein